MEHPKISVIIPAYNHEKFVGEAIESVLLQSFKDFELIIINDGSCDDTENVIKKFNDSRIKYLSQENQGACNSHNRGIEIAKGKYISFLNSDDVYHTERLDILLKIAQKEDLNFLITDIELIDEYSKIITDPAHWWLRWYEYLKSVYLSSDSPVKALLAGNFTISTSNFFFHSRIIKDIGLFKPFQYIIDYDFAFRAVRLNPTKFRFLVNNKLLSYRLHGGNTILKNPLIANFETYSFLSNAIKDIYGEDSSIPIDHLNKIKRYITKELIKRQRTEIQKLRNNFDLQHEKHNFQFKELSRKYKELDIKYKDLRFRQLSNIANYNKRLLEEIYILKNSYSFKIGRILTVPLRTLIEKIIKRSYSKPIKTTVKNINELSFELNKLIKDVDLVAFDIFDTILERRIDPPDKVKEIAAKRLSNYLSEKYKLNLSPQEILRLRDTVELELRYKSSLTGSDFECRYTDIVKEMINRIIGQYDANLFETIIKQEIEIENEVLYIKNGMLEILEEIKNKGKKIIVISDMYLDKSLIKEIIRNKGLDNLIDNIYISSDLAICKYSGNLFKHVMFEEYVLPSQMLHIGDNKTSDHRIPSKLGINSIYFKDIKNLKKKYILKTFNKLATHNSYWRGRHLLQLIQPNFKTEDFFYNLGFSFLGPVYTTFVYGVIETIKKYKLNTLYFIAREGELFLQIFNLFIPHFFKEKEAPDTKYVYLTRKSTALAALYKGLSHKKAIIPLYNPKQQGLYSLCNVYGLPVKEFLNKAREYGFSDIKTPIYNWEDKRFINFLNDKWVQERVKYYAEQDRKLLEEYLSQIGFFNNPVVAFIDIGWNATIQKFIQDAFIERQDYPHVFGLYLGFRNGMMHAFDESKNTIIGLLYDDRLNNPKEKIMNRFEEIFEEGARAQHPTTLGYKRNNKTGLLEPIFKEETAPDRISEMSFDEKINKLQRGVLDFSKEFIKAIKITGYTFEDIKPFILTIIERFVAYPNKEEVKNLMALKHAEDFGYENVMDFSTEKIDSLKTILRPKKLILKIKHSNWSYGTARSSKIPGITFLLRIYDLIWRI